MSGRRVAIVSSEVLGRPGTGGAGTADSLLALALGRHGHRVLLLVATGREIGALAPAWARTYEAAGVEVRVLERVEGVTPGYLRPSFEVLHALREDEPEVAIVNDWRGLGYLPLQAREVGVALCATAFVVHCHGPGRVLAAFAGKVPETSARYAEQVMERASLALADAVVSPSAWLLDWMRSHGWPVPEAPLVIPYPRQSAVLGESPEPVARAGPVRRLAFFGQLREGKGIRIYLEALNALDPSLLEGRELLFLGRESKRWTAEAIAAALPRARDLRVRFEPSLERSAALEELRRDGTLAVMPSLLDNAPNTVSECIEYGIPFLSTRTGGIPELVAEPDRERVLCEPTATALATALRRALESRDGVSPAAPARDPRESLQAWLELVDTLGPRTRPHVRTRPEVDVIAVGKAAEARARALARSNEAAVQVVAARSRRAGLDGSSSEWVLFLEDEDVPDDHLVDRLIAAQRASSADAVTCAVRRSGEPGRIRLFLGDPGPFGLTQNQYGVVGLARRELLGRESVPDGLPDPDWVLFARLALGGARIVSVPDALATHEGEPGAVGDVPGAGLEVLEAFEGAGLRQSELPELAATLAAALARTDAEGARPAPERLSRRGLRVLREEGPGGLVRRARGRLGR